MYCDLDEKTKDLLNNQQKSIINADEKLIFVSAGAGAGKTYTISKRIMRELEELDDCQGIIACSFTKEASRELEKRITNQVDKKNSFIGTIDSFILGEIIGTFKNRYLFNKYKEKYNKIGKLKIIYPQNINVVNNLTRIYNGIEDTNKIKSYCNEWYENFLKGIYEISFPSYKLANKILELPVVMEYIKSKYTTIYIDEAQDLNAFQHETIDILKNIIKLNVVMIGDASQSIYSFRGAKPSLFKGLIDNDYIAYNIDINVRCHPSITYLANRMVNKDKIFEKTFDSCKVNIIQDIRKEFISRIEGNFFILARTKDIAQQIYDSIKDEVDVIYSLPLDINETDYNENKDIIEEMIRYYYNFNNNVDKYKYPTENITNFLEDTGIQVNHKTIKIIKEREKEISLYIKDLCCNAGIEISDKTIELLKNKLSNKVFKDYYIKYNDKNRILTMHSAKGLECKNVLVILTPEREINDDVRRLNFVSFTRAQENLYLYIDPEYQLKNEIENILS